MGSTNAFPTEEYARRRARLRHAMAERDLQALIVTGPEEVCYLSGLANQGHFVFTSLIVDAGGEPATLVARQMEEATAAAQAPSCAFVGYRDGTNPAEQVCAVLPKLGRGERRLGYQPASLSIPVALWRELDARLDPVNWLDCGELLAQLQTTRSEAEIGFLREAGRLSDIGMRAGLIAAAGDCSGGEVVGAIEQAMLASGSDYPAFVPLVRSTADIRQEHVAWTGERLSPADTLFFELSGAAARYHAPLGRTVRPSGDATGGRAAAAARAGLDTIQTALRPGRSAAEVYHDWVATVEDELGRAYRRHHCGYLVGLGFPPSWMAGRVASLSPKSTIIIRQGMTFHIQSWVLDCNTGTQALSDTALVTERGGELLTTAPHDLTRPTAPPHADGAQSRSCRPADRYPDAVVPGW